MDQKNQLLQYLFKNHPQYFNLNQTINLNQINWNKIPVNSLIESIQKNEKNFDLSSFIKNQNENQIKNQNENQIKNEEKKIDLNSFQKEFPINYNQISKHEKLIQFIREKLDISENYYQKLVEIHLKSKNELEQISDLNFKLKLLSKISFINQNDWNFFFEWRQHQINIFIYELEKIFKKNSFKNDSQEIISKIQSLNSFGNKEGNDFNQQFYLKRIEEINNDLKQIMNQMKDFENDQKIPLLEDSIMIYFENLIEYFINLQEKVENNTLIFHLEQKEIKKIDSFQKFFSLSNFSTQVIIIKILWKKIKEVFQLEKKFSSKHDQLFLTFQTELKEIQSKEISPFLRGIFQEICSEMLVFMQNLKNYFEHFPEMISNFSKCFIILKTILNSKFNTKKIVKDFLLDHVRNLFPKNENENEQINLEFFGNLKDLIKDDLDFYSGIFFDQYSHVEKLLLKIYSQLYINFLNDFIEKHKYLDNTTLNIWKSGRLLIKFFMKKNISSNQFPNLQQFISQIFIDWMKTNTTNILSYISKIIEDEVFDVESR
ncbi:hypothetical protein M0811_04582 [Anaeramoeba ignava]|uniref:Uncharacterized protein n=1 Tax=Anaeramoeba ignava TaxID=1746090 RepID=A0A9Q0LUP9_ANAIG|nr:hypothetical protein M0811_04582 [Anaeramoeba ignava]